MERLAVGEDGGRELMFHHHSNERPNGLRGWAQSRVVKREGEGPPWACMPPVPSHSLIASPS